jgi:predicted aspartyl protease
LLWDISSPATLADGSEVTVDYYVGIVIWGDQERRIVIAALDAEPLLGMDMLRGHRLQIDNVEDGPVTIEVLNAL